MAFSDLWKKSSVWNGVVDGWQGVKDYQNKYGWGQVYNGAKGTINNIANSGSYSDFVSKANEDTNGWYSTIAGATPVLSGIHNAVLSRDSALDYLANTGLSWSDLPGYQSARLTGGTSAGITDIGRDVGKIADGIHDLGQFYSGDPKVSSFTNNMYG